ncbi:DegT/DnrJ/EryC1/StrS family aminotransferase, partial [Rhizobium johnstonii]|uniref:DegT/DnrJ/EryC1/StrS family aminotransferase n=1 Tax=Rhizobium johnstonii TaxID=3019933 RepID=UPI003F9CEEBF
RRAAADRYDDLFASVPGVRTPRSRPGNVDVWHLYVVQVDERDRLMEHLVQHGVSASIHYPTPLHLPDASAHLGIPRGTFPVAEAA